MSIQRLHVASRYSEAVIHNGVIHLAGQLADDLSGAVEEAAGDEAAHALLSAAADQARRHADELAALAAGRKSRSTIVA